MTHIIGVIYGIAAAVVCAGGFYFAGLVFAGRRGSALAGAASFPVLGAAAYVVTCWVAVTAWHMPLTRVSAAFLAVVTSLAVLRFRALKPVITIHIVNRTFATGTLLFTAFYTLTYLLVRPPAAELALPSAIAGQINAITYARYARHLIVWGSPDLAAATFDFSRSPAVAVLLSAWSVFYHHDPSSAALPMQFAAVALLGVTAFSISRSLFRLSMIASLTIASILLTSVYVSNVTDTYRVETAIAVPIALYLIWATAKIRAEAAAVELALTFVPGYALLLLTETAALPGVVALQALLIGGRISASPAAARLAVAAASALAVVLLAFHHQVRASATQVTFAGGMLSAGLVLAILVMSGVAFTALNRTWSVRLLPAPADQKLMRALTAYVAIALVVGNVAAHAFTDRDAAVRVPAAWQHVERLNEHTPRHLTLKLARDRGDILAELVRYYLPQTNLDVIPAGAQLPGFETISRQFPLLIQNFGCEGVGHDDTVAVTEVGCLLLAPPSVTLDTSYPFYRTFLAIDFDNMSSREAGGRWSTRKPLQLTLAADPQRAPVDRNLHVNLLVHPFLPDEVSRQRLVVTWGANRKGVVDVSGAGWVSIPADSGDWSGNRVWTLPIAINFPDGGTILFEQLSLTEMPLGALVR